MENKTEEENKECICCICKKEMKPDNTKYIILEVATIKFYCYGCLIKKTLEEIEEEEK